MAPTTIKSAWMDPQVRAWLIAIRPWSLTASLLPVCVTGAVLHDCGRGISLYSGAYISCILVVVCLHAAANLFNTYYDFVSGTDAKETADDRGLVDNTVGADTVWKSAVGFWAVAMGNAAVLVANSGSDLLYMAGPASALAVAYTAGGPYSLKGLGLGDVVMFLMFGPMLTAGTCLATVHAVQWLPMCYSVPQGLLTVAILHANNARDAKVDAKSGLKTVAMTLGKEGSVTYHKLLMCLAYGAVFAMPLVATTSCRQYLVATCIPWALYVTRRFASARFHELPQAIAQHNLLFSVILTGALSEPKFVARVMLACLFYLGGVNNVIMWAYNRELVRIKLENVLPGVSPTAATAMFASAVASQTLIALAFMLGFHEVLMAKLLLAILIGFTFFVHDIWTIEDEVPVAALSSSKEEEPGGPAIASRRLPNFPTEFDNEFVHFFKNVGMMGGLVLFLELQP